MCGINGFNFQDERLIKEMVGATRHRGPDQEGFYCDNKVSLGHARLSIIDLSDNARQPLWNEDGSLCIIFNGEIYNFQELKKQLLERGHKFRSLSDTEVILHLYEDKGTDCIKELNGIYVEFFGKSSQLNKLTKKISSLDVSQRPKAGKQINKAKKGLWCNPKI